MKKITLAPPLRFFSDEEHATIPKAIDQFPYFLYELKGNKTPWLERGHGLEEVMNAWVRTTTVLEEKHCRRQKDVQEEMNTLLALFFMALFWTNGQPAAPALWEQKEKDLEVKPINFHERFQFITARPYTYAAFRQLMELMNEQRKAAAVHAIRKR
ncbi:YpoC family protein [Domibacillus epiphyticus]|uniref:YpoC-like domain-containing protein n=1 Tax=Domibacillus epiphyticus TaxID=1714355 RepID=A0A1V2A4U8_9BACI|nr:hypothetical protein [Domibacillus epiphyticus]OMP65834.1 hypothetical protein BTO28_14845 [Domibacillus epiphyticus]